MAGANLDDLLASSSQMAGWTVLLGLLTVLVAVYWSLPRTYVVDGRRLPLPSGPWLTIPWLGDPVFFSKDPLAALRARRQKYGEVYQTRLLGRRTVMVADPGLVRKLLLGEHDTVNITWGKAGAALLGQHSLQTMTGAAHVRLRKALIGAFVPKAIAAYTPRIAHTAQQYCERWAQQGRIMGSDEVNGFTFEVMLELVLGLDKAIMSAAERKRMHDAFVVWGEGFTTLGSGTKFRRSMAARQEMLDLIEAKLRVVQDDPDRVLRAGAVKSTGQVFLEVTDDDGNKLSMDELKDQFLLLMSAGHDTSATTLLYLLRELPRHPRVIQRLRAEQAQVMAAHGDDITEAALREMRYTDACVREVLRWRPIVGAVFRKAIRTFQLGSYAIPEGWGVLVQTGLAMEGDPRWDQPAEYRPERWLAPDGSPAKPGFWMPFGGGPRECLGYQLAMAEMKAFLAVLVRGYRWELEVPQEKMVQRGLFARPEHGAPMRVTRIDPPTAQQQDNGVPAAAQKLAAQHKDAAAEE